MSGAFIYLVIILVLLQTDQVHRKNVRLALCAADAALQTVLLHHEDCKVHDTRPDT